MENSSFLNNFNLNISNAQLKGRSTNKTTSFIKMFYFILCMLMLYFFLIYFLNIELFPNFVKRDFDHLNNVVLKIRYLKTLI